MKVYKSLSAFQRVPRAILTTGTFDGVHVGHQVIIKRLQEIARREDGETVLLTFWPHPRMVLFPDDNDLRLLNTLDEKLELLEAYGIGHCIVHPFTKEFSRTTALQYVRDILVGQIGVHKLVIGYDHHFGRNREGSLEQLTRMGPEYGFTVEEIPAQEVDDVNVSSTKIRKALLAGNVTMANSFLGYPYAVHGKVVAGRKIGRTLGYPTANIDPGFKFKLIPGNGIYAVTAKLDGKAYPGMANVGVRPTLAEENPEVKIEVNIFDLNQDLYDREITLTFYKWVREEKHFRDLDALKVAMKDDEAYIRNWFNVHRI